jgi:hypothetical protein
MPAQVCPKKEKEKSPKKCEEKGAAGVAALCCRISRETV